VDLSIGQRLVLGFGIASALIVTLVAASHVWTREVAAIRHRQLAVIAPRAAAADGLESAVLYVAVAARNCVISPEPARRETLETALARMRRETQVLALMAREPDGAIVAAQAPGLAVAYEGAVRDLVDSAGAADAPDRAVELRTARAREELLAVVREYGALQRTRLEETRAEITRAVERMDAAVVNLGLAALALGALTGVLTARSVRRPALALVRAARRMGAGDFEPALAMNVAADVHRRDELAELSSAFGRMGVELKAREEGLLSQKAEIQAQEERLRAQYEEIHSQYEQIQAQNEELQSQNEELQAQREELQSQGEALQQTVDRLAVSEEALRQTDRNKNDFLALLSHELRNPLAPIKNSLYVLGRVDPGSQQAEQARLVIERQVGQLARLVEDLLDVARISRGRVQLRRAPLDLARLVADCAADCRASFAASGITLEVDLPASPVLVDGDATRLSQVVGNLLQNAAKFTPAGGSVRLGLRTEDGRAQLRVHDSGAGMEKETLSRLFQPFMQGDVDLARTNAGLGLGLSLVKALVEMHGGSVTAASEGRGMGSDFLVTLPLGGDGRSASELHPLPLAAGTERRVLVVEDNVDAAASLRDVLALGKHEVDVAYTGAEAIAKARACRPHLVLCDIGLPDLNGHEVAAAFRRDPLLQSVYLVALTGYALPEDIRKATDSGFDEHLPKPPSIERLNQILAALPTAALLDGSEPGRPDERD
jgi:signal transduction histidine kinase/ActR/RegA family two-component response regulator